MLPRHSSRLRRLIPLLPLRWHLVAITIGVLLPIVSFIAGLLSMLGESERVATERRLAHRARILADELDSEVASTIRALEVLASSSLLDQNATQDADLHAFYDVAKRAHATQPSWMSVVLFAPDSRAVFNTRYAWGETPPPVVESESLHRAIATQTTVIGSLRLGKRNGTWAFPVRVPIVRDGKLKYILTAVTEARSVVHAMAGDDEDEEWTRLIVDREGTVVLRTRGSQNATGTQIDRTLGVRLRGAPYGVIADRVDGVDVNIAFRRAPVSGWTASVMVPRSQLDASARRSRRFLFGSGLTVLILSGGGVFALGRRLSRSIGSAANGADRLAHGARPEMPASRVTEIERLREALERSSELLMNRERERDELLLRAQEARDEALAASSAKDEFLAMLGHELRNPLAAIITAIELIKRRGQAMTRPHGIIERQAQHLVRLVDDLLDVARIARGKFELQSEPVEIATAITQAVEATRPLFDSGRHVLQIDAPVNGLIVHGDLHRLTQAITNLLTNAVRYSPNGGVIEVVARRDRRFIEVEVKDEGQGIHAELLPRIFDLFVQGERGSDRRQGGLGLGLTIVRMLIVAHGGDVEARSDGPGTGSTFVLRLPAVDASVDTALRSSARMVAARKERVLVVDDNEDIATLLTELLSGLGYEVTVAYEPLLALELAKRDVPAVAILDIGLPGIDGYELAARMREALGEDAPALIALTGYGQVNDRVRALEAGFARHFTKPPNYDDLSTAVSELAVFAHRRRENARSRRS